VIISSALQAFKIAKSTEGLTDGIMVKLGKKTIAPYYVILPGILFLIFMAIYPLAFSFWISFSNWDLLDPEHYFVGLKNYKNIILDGNFWNAVLVTGTFTVSAVSIEIIFGFIIALLINNITKGRRFFQTIFLLPVIVAPAISGLMWRFMLNYEYGVLNFFMTVVHLQRHAWLAEKSFALPAIILTDIWQWTPFMTIILLAGLQSLPDEPMEAARIDGCSSWQRFWLITLPMMKRVTTIALVLRTIDAFRIYDIIFMMTRGGPVNATSSLSWIIYERGFKTFELHKSAAMSWLMLIIVTVIIMIILKNTKIEDEN
jgi:multiple sugar transport system permease protein